MEFALIMGQIPHRSPPVGTGFIARQQVAYFSAQRAVRYLIRIASQIWLAISLAYLRYAIPLLASQSAQLGQNLYTLQSCPTQRYISQQPPFGGIGEVPPLILPFAKDGCADTHKRGTRLDGDTIVMTHSP